MINAHTPVLYSLPVVHLAWKQWVCRGNVVFDITVQHKTTNSLKTRNRLINFVMLPEYYIGKIMPIYRISAIFAHKRPYASFLARSAQ